MNSLRLQPAGEHAEIILITQSPKLNYGALMVYSVYSAFFKSCFVGSSYFHFRQQIYRKARRLDKLIKTKVRKCLGILSPSSLRLLLFSYLQTQLVRIYLVSTVKTAQLSSQSWFCPRTWPVHKNRYKRTNNVQQKTTAKQWLFPLRTDTPGHNPNLCYVCLFITLI